MLCYLCLYPLISMFSASVLYSVYCIFSGNHDTSTWILPYKANVPFDMDTIHRWYIVLFVQANMSFSYFLVMIMISSCFVCCCFYIEALGEHFEFIINSLKGDVEPNRTGGNAALHQKKYQKIKETLSQAVYMQIKAVECVFLNS